MNKPLISALALGTALPAFAGPDWQAIEQAQKAKQATQKAGHGDAMPAKGADAMTCPPDALVLPLDHGRPRRPCAGARGVAPAQGKARRCRSCRAWHATRLAGHGRAGLARAARPVRRSAGVARWQRQCLPRLPIERRLRSANSPQRKST